jgi:hypothetical protein
VIARFGARATPRTSSSAHSNCVGNRRNLFGVQDSSFGRFDGELWPWLRRAIGKQQRILTGAGYGSRTVEGNRVEPGQYGIEHEAIDSLAVTKRRFVSVSIRAPGGRALTVGEIGALSDFDNVTVRIADVAAYLAVLGNRLRDELGSSTFP